MEYYPVYGNDVEPTRQDIDDAELLGAARGVVFKNLGNHWEIARDFNGVRAVHGADLPPGIARQYPHGVVAQLARFSPPGSHRVVIENNLNTHVDIPAIDGSPFTLGDGESMESYRVLWGVRKGRY